MGRALKAENEACGLRPLAREISAYTWCVTEKGPQRKWLHKIGKEDTPGCHFMSLPEPDGTIREAHSGRVCEADRTKEGSGERREDGGVANAPLKRQREGKTRRGEERKESTRGRKWSVSFV